MTRADRIALFMSLLAVLAGFLVSDLVFERLSHIEDEIAYLWQAQVIARNQLSLPSPEQPKSFLVPFVIDYNGQRFGKYPLGWPVVLSFGVRLGVHYLVNPLLAGLGLWLTYRLGKRVLSETVGLIAAGLTLTSPFFLMNSGSLLSHPLGLVLSAGFALAWLDAFAKPSTTRRWLATITAAGALGILVLTRPLTAAAVAIPFAMHGLYLLWCGNSDIRKRLALFVLIVLALTGLHFAWQYAVTGDALMNPYTLWWEYDKIGFGPGHGHSEEGHTLEKARINTRFSLRSGWHDLFGWAGYSWLFLPPGILAIRKNKRAWLLASVVLSLVLVYTLYWIGSALFGPRYYYEGLYSLTIVSAAGICLLAGWPLSDGEPFPNYRDWRRIRTLGVTAFLALLVSANLLFYTPVRLGGMHALYGISREHQEPFVTESAQELAPALMIVHTSGNWAEYGTLLELQNPFLDTPFIFIITRSPVIDQEVASHFPDRNVFHYYPDEPYTFYKTPRAP
jgi:hypothetical protein